jgi:Flp pilus assembly CpaE family ATPase
VDTPRRADRATREVLARADVVVIVTDLTLPAMRDCQRLVKLANGLRPRGEVLVLANRVGGAPGELPKDEFAKGAGAAVAFAAPAEPKAAQAAAEQAKPLAEAAGTGPLAGEIRRLAARLAGAEAGAGAGAAETQPGAWLRRMLGRA